MSSLQICGLATYLLLQGTVFAVAPEEVIFMSMGVLWSQGRVELVEALIACFLGLLPANSLMVFVSGHFKRSSLIQKPSIQRALALVKSKGRWVIVVTRFTPIVRAPVYASIGLSGMPLIKFFTVDAATALFHIPLIFFVGAYIGRKTGSILEAYKVIAAIALTVAACILTVFFIAEWRRKRAAKPASPAST